MINTNLDRLMRSIGWGDPNGGLWFIGLEEGSDWRDQGEIDDFLSRESLKKAGDAQYESFAAPEAGQSVSRDSRSQVWLFESKIAAALSATVRGPYDYAGRCLWFNGFGTFHGNLLPLGKPRLANWPAHYRSLFGLGPEDRDRYTLIVRKRRYPTIRDLHKASRPQATICFGKTYWMEFEDLFDLWADEPADGSDTSLRIFSEKRIVLAPFFGVGQMSDALCARLIQLLQQWQVRLP